VTVAVTGSGMSLARYSSGGLVTVKGRSRASLSAFSASGRPRR
jgi:hypothetical protein